MVLFVHTYALLVHPYSIYTFLLANVRVYIVEIDIITL